MMQAAQDKLLVKYPCLSLTSAYIDGQWMKALSSFDDVCPTTEEVIVSVANCGASQVTEAVEAARRAFRIWGISPVSHRSQFLRRLADLIDRDRDDLATLESIDEGKPLRESLSDIGDAAGLARHLADLIEITDMEDVVVDNGTAEFKTSVLTEPLGVVAAITPWNYPFLMACQKSLTAIATGCTVILKPSELAPLSCLVLADLCHEAGLPDGVLNITPGLGSLTGEALSNACVDKVSFTGSLPTARKIMAAAALGPRAVSLELGGKSALIAFEDSDVSAAVDWIIMGFVWGSGQVCSATSRVLVHTNLLPKLLPALIAKLEKLSIGDPLIEGVNVGPVVNKAQYDKIWTYIEGARSEGIQCIYGGTKHFPGCPQSGLFIPPTVFLEPSSTSRVWIDEIFGPVLCIKTFETEAEAIEMANESAYGLAGAVFSSDKDRCARVARALRVGVVWVNCSQPAFVQAPWGGCKSSGFGRELGKWGIEEFSHIKQVTACDNGFSWALWS